MVQCRKFLGPATSPTATLYRRPVHVAGQVPTQRPAQGVRPSLQRAAAAQATVSRYQATKLYSQVRASPFHKMVKPALRLGVVVKASNLRDGGKEPVCPLGIQPA